MEENESNSYHCAKNVIVTRKRTSESRCRYWEQRTQLYEYSRCRRCRVCRFCTSHEQRTGSEQQCLRSQSFCPVPSPLFFFCFLRHRRHRNSHTTSAETPATGWPASRSLWTHTRCGQSCCFCRSGDHETVVTTLPPTTTATTTASTTASTASTTPATATAIVHVFWSQSPDKFPRQARRRCPTKRFASVAGSSGSPLYIVCNGSFSDSCRCPGWNYSRTIVLQRIVPPVIVGVGQKRCSWSCRCSYTRWRTATSLFGAWRRRRNNGEASNRI